LLLLLAIPSYYASIKFAKYVAYYMIVVADDRKRRFHL
jgi:hypothetical protein